MKLHSTLVGKRQHSDYGYYALWPVIWALQEVVVPMNPALFPWVCLEQSQLEEQDLIGCALGLWSAVLSSNQWPMLNGVAVPIEVEAWGHSFQATLFELLRAEEGV